MPNFNGGLVWFAVGCLALLLLLAYVLQHLRI